MKVGRSIEERKVNMKARMTFEKKNMHRVGSLAC